MHALSGSVCMHSVHSWVGACVVYGAGGDGTPYASDLVINKPWRQWQGPILIPRYAGQTKTERWWEVWGVRNGVPGPRDFYAPHNKPVPSWSHNRCAPPAERCAP